MITILDGYPDDVLAISATGRVTAEDYRTVLVPEVEARLNRHHKIRFLYWFGEEFESFSPGAMLADASFGFAHLRNLGRSALVTDVRWIAGAAWLLSPLLRAPFRIFANADFEKAREWVLSGEPDA